MEIPGDLDWPHFGGMIDLKLENGRRGSADSK